MRMGLRQSRALIMENGRNVGLTNPERGNTRLLIAQIQGHREAQAFFRETVLTEEDLVGMGVLPGHVSRFGMAKGKDLASMKPVMKGDDFRKYKQEVLRNTEKYKRMKAELSELRSEWNVLSRTAGLLCATDRPAVQPRPRCPNARVSPRAPGITALF